VLYYPRKKKSNGEPHDGNSHDCISTITPRAGLYRDGEGIFWYGVLCIAVVSSKPRSKEGYWKVSGEVLAGDKSPCSLMMQGM
jgi:hypothetical protein